MADVLKKVPVREQDPKVRATNFDEVCLGYNKEEAMEEASRCLNCKNAKCVEGCPVSINIPDFIAAGKRRQLRGSIQQSSPSPAHFRQSADVSAHRRASVRANVSAVSRASLFPSVSWSVSLLTGQERTVSSRQLRQRRTARRLQSSVPVLPA